MNTTLFKLHLYTLALSLLTPTAFAAWSLDNQQSRLNFISIKATDIGEVHTFTQLSGGIADDGAMAVAINLASVETFIPIRNERMQEFLFETNLFPSATITATLDNARLNNLTSGSITPQTIQATLTIKDQSVPLTVMVFVAKLSSNKIMVTAAQPIIITPASVGLNDGVEKLRELAGLVNISQAVPISFTLTFNGSDDPTPPSQ